jgi:hypothetical protein
MADTSLRTRLQRLFSNQVFVRRLGKDRLKVVDTNRLQSSGNVNQTRFVDRFAGVHTYRNYGTNTYNAAYNFHSSKLQLYADYEAMDLDAILSSALDVYSDEVTVKAANDELLVIKSDNDQIKKILYNLFYDILNVDYNLWPWTRNLCKYGDFYLHLDIEEGIGIVNVTPMSAYEVRREEGFDPNNPYAVRFTYEGSHKTYSKTFKQHYDSFEIAHFRLLSDTNFLPYGRSMIEPARKVFKQLILMEDAMLIHRIMRAPERRIFKIDVGNIPPNEVDSHIANIITKMKKIPYIDQATGEYNLEFNMQNMLEDFYLPVRGGDSGTAIENLPGLGNDGQIEDIEYLRNKMMAALKIPKAFLGYDEGVEGKSTLAAEDVRFARTIERIQRIVTAELTKIAIVHLYSQGFENEDLINFELTLTSPSIIYEKQKIDLLTSQIGLAKDMQDSTLFSRKYIYETIFGLTKDEWQEQEALVIEDTKTAFRIEQIKSEGNDPVKTNMSFGTPHDIASMHIANKFYDPRTKENVAGPGRPKETGTFGKHKDDFGRDPLAAKEMTSTLKADNSVEHKFKGGNPLSMESKEHSNFIKSLSKIKTKSIVQTTLLHESEDKDKGTMLDEDNLIEIDNI